MGGVEEGRREWVDMTNPELFKSVYVEKRLLWARRILPSEQSRAVAWPARVSQSRGNVLNCGTNTPSHATPQPKVWHVEVFATLLAAQK